ncbi:MAG TPA: hypothetical protein DD611_03930 [Alphaproteobacteria bacterium]|nr:hypothetical protein [Alphaproteobacteria bacterium]
MKKDLYKANFDKLVHSLQKYCLDYDHVYGNRKSPKRTYFSKKYNSYISERTVYSGRVSGLEYHETQRKFWTGEISKEDFKKFHDKFVAQNPWFLEIPRHSREFRIFSYLENNRFCLDIEENKVRTKLISLKIPEEIKGDHNGEIAVAFEQCINRQIDKYLRQKQTNIDIVTELP